MIKLYYADISGSDLKYDEKQLSEYRLCKLNKIKPKDKKRQSVAAEILLNHAVKDNAPELKLPLMIKTGEYGKPFCDNLPFKFSLSHSGDIVICGISDTEIGADVQLRSEYREKLAKRQFTEAENRHIERAENADEAFTEIWAKKESYIKALGIGINLRLSSFSVVPENEILLEGKKLSLWSGKLGDYSLALCVSGDEILQPEIIEVKL